MKNDVTEAVMRELALHGLTGRIEPRGKHQAIVWEQDGASKSYLCSLTPSDYRAPIKARADIRRMMQSRDTDATPDNVVFLPSVHVDGDCALTDSRHVAEVFGKDHKNVLRDIDNLLKSLDCSDLSRQLFRPVMVEDASGIQRRAFDITRDGFTLLAMGFTGAKALRFKLAFIDAFKALENAVLTGGLSTALSNAEKRIATLEGEMSAVTDLVLEAPASAPSRKGTFIRPSVMRKLRRMA